MKPLSLLLVLLLLLLPQQVLSEERPGIVIAADQWCPINCVPGSDRPGFMIEIARTCHCRGVRGECPGFHFPENEQGRATLWSERGDRQCGYP